MANALAEEGDLIKIVKYISKGTFYCRNNSVFINSVFTADFSLGINDSPSVEKMKEALKASNYKAWDSHNREDDFIGFATLYESNILVAIFDSLEYHTDAMVIHYGIPVITDCSVSGIVQYNDIQAMNDSLTEGGGIETVYYNDGRVEHYQPGKAGEKKF